MIAAAIWIVGAYVALQGIKRWRRTRVYHCRINGCGRTFIDPLERSAHYRRTH